METDYLLSSPILQADLDFAIFLSTRQKHKVARERFTIVSDIHEYDRATAENLAFIRNYQLRPKKRAS